MRKQKFRKTKLSLALTSVLGGGLVASGPAAAVELDNIDRLGDAALFQYYTAQGNWQTFFRLINTSNRALVVKLRYREAANSREVLDFELALSPGDMWSAWTDRDPLGDGSGPGIRTNDTSCIFPLVQQGGGAASEGFVWVDQSTNLAGALFKDRGFTGIYDDNGTTGGLTAVDRMSEGYLEVIGVASYPCEGGDESAFFCSDVSHNETGKPNSCQQAYNRFNTGSAAGEDVPNALAANAYLVNVPTGQGAGYDPDMLRDCATASLESQALATDTEPDFDSCDAGVFGTQVGNQVIAVNQRLWNGTVPPGTATTFFEADLDGDNAFTSQFTIDLGNGQCTQMFEDNVTEEVYNAAQVNSDPGDGSTQLSQFLAGGGGCDWQLVATGGDLDTPVLTATRDEELPFARIKQKGWWFSGDLPVNQWPVTGGVDAVSREFMRTGVINEWAASFDPQKIIIDYFTQWVLTFPTKHYYVDLQTDENPFDDISPTLLDPSPENDAFAPFSQEFDDGATPGTSCEPYVMDITNREESWVDYTSPRPPFDLGLCWETNVVNFNERYADRGLASNFAVTIPESVLPYDYTHDKVAERGWAQMTFTGPGANVGLTDRFFNYYGLPVTGFLFSVYNTLSAEINHTAVNAHKYTREQVSCIDDPDACAP